MTAYVYVASERRGFSVSFILACALCCVNKYCSVRRSHLSCYFSFLFDVTVILISNQEDTVVSLASPFLVFFCVVVLTESRQFKHRNPLLSYGGMLFLFIVVRYELIFCIVASR